MATCYGCKAPCSSITECRQQLWAQKTEVNSSTENCVVCHQQLKHLSKKFTEHICRLPSGTVPWELHLISMLWITDGKQMKQTIVPHPRNMAGVPYAPEQILNLVKYGCVSERSCKGANCGCMGHQLPCPMFCACGGGRAYLNAF